MKVNVLLFEGFTALDAFGPVEVLSCLEDTRLEYYSFAGGVVTNRQNIRIETLPLSQADLSALWLIPGGFGTRGLVEDTDFLSGLKKITEEAQFCLSVCTGAALLARCGALDGRRATTNRKAFDWVASCGEGVLWDREARWVSDGKFYTSAGVSAGIDMALGFVTEQFGEEQARAIALRMESAHYSKRI